MGISGSSLPAMWRSKRVTWIALRTLREVPKLLGETEAGDAIVEIRSGRLVLPANACHFRRIAACSTCGADAPGQVVLAPSDLDEPSQPLICQSCARSDTPASPPRRTTAGPPTTPLPAIADASPVAVDPTARPADDARLVALERRVSELAALVQAQHAQLEQNVNAQMGGTPEQEASGTRLDELAGGLQQLQADTEAESARVREGLSRLAERLDSEGRSLQESLAHGLAEVQRSAAAHAGRLAGLEEALAKRDFELEELYDLHAALDEGMGELRSGLVARRAAENRLATALEEVYRRLEAVSDAQMAARANQRRRGRSGRKAATEPAAGLTELEHLVREHRQLRDRVVTLERSADEARTAVVHGVVARDRVQSSPQQRPAPPHPTG